jgi:hypothetical protein
VSIARSGGGNIHNNISQCVAASTDNIFRHERVNGMYLDARRLFRQIKGFGFRGRSSDSNYPTNSSAAQAGYTSSGHAKNGDGYQAGSK